MAGMNGRRLQSPLSPQGRGILCGLSGFSAEWNGPAAYTASVENAAGMVISSSSQSALQDTSSCAMPGGW